MSLKFVEEYNKCPNAAQVWSTQALEDEFNKRNSKSMPLFAFSQATSLYLSTWKPFLHILCHNPV